LKNKGVTYLLLAVVCAIWGIIIFRIIKGLSGDEEVNNVNNTQTFTSNDKNEETYTIIASYRDPFLGGVRQANVNREPTSRSTSLVKPKVKVSNPVIPIPVPVVPVVIIDWSFIQYKGQISNKGGKAVGIVTIRGNEHLITANSKVADVKIMTVSKDSILVEYNGMKKGIFRY